MISDIQSSDVRSALERIDIDAIRRLWAHVAPHLPQPKGDYGVQVMIHSARTQCRSIAFRYRAYSHQWLLANGLPSPLPDQERPRAERRDFQFAVGVGIAIKATTPLGRAVKPAVVRACGARAAELVGNGVLDSTVLSREIQKTRARTLKALIGRIR